MRRFLLIVLLFIFSSSILNSSITYAQITSYSNEVYGYKIDFPNGWEITENADKSEVVALNEQEYSLGYIRVLVTKNDLNLHEGYLDLINTPDAARRNLTKFLGKEFSNANITDAGMETINNMQSAWVIFTSNFEDIELKTLNYLFITRDYVYIVNSTTTPIDSFPSFKDQFNTSVSSFTIDNYKMHIQKTLSTNDNEPFYVRWIGILIFGGVIAIIGFMSKVISKIFKRNKK